jgi:hypothetical protein
VTVIDKLIQYQFWFEYGIGKFGIYIGILNLTLIIIANLTLKGIFFPLWGAIPIAIMVVITGVVFGYYLITGDVASRLQSHANQNANPELNRLLDTMDRIEAKIDALEKKL